MIRSEQDLARLRDQKRAEIRAKGVRVMVSMSSCAIAAGAVAVFEKLEKRVAEICPDRAVVEITGCAGICYAEPTLEIIRNDTRLLLGNVRPESVEDIIHFHIIGNSPKSSFVIEATENPEEVEWQCNS